MVVEIYEDVFEGVEEKGEFLGGFVINYYRRVIFGKLVDE